MLKICRLKKYFPVTTSSGRMREHVKALDGSSLEIQAGEPFGLVGESGCKGISLGLLCASTDRANFRGDLLPG